MSENRAGDEAWQCVTARSAIVQRLCAEYRHEIHDQPLRDAIEQFHLLVRALPDARKGRSQS